MMCRKNQDGMITVEATISLTVFIFFIIFFYSLIFMTTAQNKINQALLSSANSLSLDSYMTEKFQKNGDASLKGALANALGITGSSSASFSSGERWYAGDAIPETVKTRFEGYLAGGSAQAAAWMDKMDITDVSFADSYVDGNGNLIIKMKYKITPLFNFFDLNSFTTTCEVKVKMWGYSS